MIDLPTYFRREAACYALEADRTERLAKLSDPDFRKASQRSLKGWETRKGGVA